MPDDVAPPPDEPDGIVRSIALDATQLTTLAHPLRSRLLTALRQHGTATATALAQRLGTNSGTTSYHLRKLADVGLVVDAPDEGDGRDRWWRAASKGHSWAEQDFLDDPDAAAAADWLHGHYLRIYVRAAEDWAEQRHTWPREWIGAADMSDQHLRVTPEGLQALTTELHEVLERHRVAADPGVPGAHDVLVVLQAFPLVADR